MANISRAERERRAAAALALAEKEAEQQQPVVPGVVARPLPEELPTPPRPLEVVKTKYQLGRECYERHNPKGDFGTLTESQQARWIEQGGEEWKP